MMNKKEIAALVGILCGLWGAFQLTPLPKAVDALLSVTSGESMPADAARDVSNESDSGH